MVVLDDYTSLVTTEIVMLRKQHGWDGEPYIYIYTGILKIPYPECDVMICFIEFIANISINIKLIAKGISEYGYCRNYYSAF